MELRLHQGLYMAGQIAGVEGYVGSIASGWLAGTNVARQILGERPAVLPVTTMLGALCHYVGRAEPDQFQPMKANFGLLPPLKLRVRVKRDRYRAYAERALTDLACWIEDFGGAKPGEPRVSTAASC